MPTDPRLDLPEPLLVDPLARFAHVFRLAAEAEPEWFNAASLATVGDDGRPTVRVVLVKAFDEQGFVFYTNTHSRKGRELASRPAAALCFHWPALQEQVRIEGDARPVSQAEADAYFATRPRGSQIGAWASKQSEPLDSRRQLEERVARFEREFAGRPVPRPPHWSGYRLVPDHIEFWIGLPSRLHDRTLYSRTSGGWSRTLLAP